MVDKLVELLVSSEYNLNEEALELVIHMSTEQVIDATNKASSILESLRTTSLGKALL